MFTIRLRGGFTYPTNDSLTNNSHNTAWKMGRYWNKFDQICQIAPLHGHFNMVKFACKNDPSVAETACYTAVRNGYLEIVEFANHIWKVCDDKCGGQIFCSYGKFKILKWIITTGYVPKKNLYQYVISYDQINVLKWKQTEDPNWDLLLCSELASHHHKHIREWLESV
jgi:hypothetical protein